MTIKYSQEYIKQRLGRQLIKKILAGSGANEAISLVDGGSGNDSITCDGTVKDFVVAGFKLGDAIYVLQATDANDNIVAVENVGVTASTILLPTATFNTGESDSTSVIVLACDGGSAKNILNNLNVTIFDGSQPDSPDNAATQKGSATALITYRGFAYGDPTWDATNLKGDLATKDAITADADNNGTGTWFRCWLGDVGTEAANRDNAATDKVRWDGSVGQVSGDLLLTNTTFTAGNPSTLQNVAQFFKQAGAVL